METTDRLGVSGELIAWVFLGTPQEVFVNQTVTHTLPAPGLVCGLRKCWHY